VSEAIRAASPGGENIADASSDASLLPGPRPYFLVAQLRLALVQRLDKELRPLGMTPALSVALNAVSYARTTSSAKLARLLGITPQSVNQTVTTLEKRGLVRRELSTHDQRVLTLVVTEAGIAMQNKCFDAVTRIYREVFGGLAPEQLQTLQELLVTVLKTARPEALRDYRDVRRSLGKTALPEGSGQ
jgi:DNA-binding MarR family transcriptional regulator